MKIEYIRGNLVTTYCPIILHGCNAQGKMGAGVAEAIRDRFPYAYTTYMETYAKQGNQLYLGQVIVARHHLNYDPIVFNAITQQYYGRKAQVYVDYDAIRTVMQKCNDLVLQLIPVPEDRRVAMPKIGSKLGGGDWEKIATIIEEESVDFIPVVYLL